MGLFSFNYAKPGPGVDKNAPKKKGFFLYFEIFRRKFFKLLQANMLYFLCSLPFLAIIFFLTPIGDLSKNLAESVVSQNADLNFNDVYLQFDATLRVCFALLLFIRPGIRFLRLCDPVLYPGRAYLAFKRRKG